MVQLARFLAGGIALLLIGDFLDKKALQKESQNANNKQAGEKLDDKTNISGSGGGDSNRASAEQIETKQPIGE